MCESKMVKTGLNNFVKTISVREFHNQNERHRKQQEEEDRDIPRGACFDKYHNMYVPYGPHFYRRVNAQKLVLYRRGYQRRVKMRERRNDKWDISLTIDKTTTLLNEVIISHKGLNKEDRRFIENSTRKISKKIPVYKYFNEYSFTQVIPPITRKNVRPPPFHDLLLFPNNLKIHGGIINLKRQFKQEIIHELRKGFQYSPVMQSYYECRIIREEEEDSQDVKAQIERKREDRIDFRGFAPLHEVVRAFKSIYEGNFSTPSDQEKFGNLVKEILLTSSEFIISQQEFVLGYADIYFAQCFIPTKRFFPYWKQTVCKYTPKSPTIHEPPDHEIVDETYSDWISESSYGQTLFVEGELIGMENYCKVSIEVVRLKSTGEEKGEEGDSEEKEGIIIDQQEPIISGQDPNELMIEGTNTSNPVMNTP